MCLFLEMLWLQKLRNLCGEGVIPYDSDSPCKKFWNYPLQNNQRKDVI